METIAHKDMGMLITFEGIDGCGKSTQLTMLSELLTSLGYDILYVREPGGTVIGEKIRELLLSKKNDMMVPMAELLLFEAARAQITEEVIRPSILSGKIVLCDRFYDSSYAYQGVARDLGKDMVKALNMFATSGLKPDLTFVLDIDVKTALERRFGRDEAEDRIEALGTKFQEDVRRGYLEAGEEEPDRIKIIDAARVPDEIHEDIKDIVLDFINAK